MSAPKERDTYAVAASAGRAAIDRALAAEAPLTVWRVFAVLLQYGPLYSRLSDHVSTSVIIRKTGMDERSVRRATTWLRKNGVVDWEPGDSPKGGRRYSSTVVFPPVDRGSNNPRGRSDPGASDPRGLERTDRGSNAVRTPGSGNPPSEKPSGASSEKAGARSASAPTSSAADAAAPVVVGEHVDALRDALLVNSVEKADGAEQAEAMAGDELAREVDDVVAYLARVAPDHLLDLACFVDDCMPIGDQPRELLRMVINWEGDDADIDAVGSAIEADCEQHTGDGITDAGWLLKSGRLPDRRAS